MPSVLLFITGVLAGVIAGFILSRMFGRRRSGDGAGEMRLLEEQLHRSDQGLEQARQQLEAQSSELKTAQEQMRGATEQAAVSRTQLAAVSQERDELKINPSLALIAMGLMRSEKGMRNAAMVETAKIGSDLTTNGR